MNEFTSRKIERDNGGYSLEVDSVYYVDLISS